MELSQVLTALRNADAAGDTEGASRLAEIARGMSAGATVAPIQQPKQSTVLGEAARGAKQLVSSARTGLESLVSPEEAAIKGVERGQQISEAAGEGPSFAAVKKAYDERGLLPAAGEALSQLPKALAGQGANLAAMAGGARLGATAGAAFGPIGAGLGGAAGAGLALLPQFAGANVERQAQEQMEAGKPVDINRTKAYGAAAGQAALEGGATAFTLGKGVVKGILGIADDAALMTAKAQAELVKAAERSLTGTVARGAARGTAEIPVEIAQQVLERAQAGLPLTGKDAYNEYGEAAYLAGLTGGGIGSIASVYNRSQAQDQVQAQQAAEAAKQAPTPEKEPLQIGMSQPFTPVVFPDGSVATTPEDVQRHLGEQFHKQFEAQPVKPPEQLDLFGGEELSRAKQEEAPAPKTVETPAELEALRAKDERAAVKADTAERKALEEAGQLPLNLRRTPEGQPTASGQPEPTISAEEVMMTAIPLPKPVQQWVEKNVTGRTLSQVRSMVAADPTLIEGRTPRAQLLKTLLASEVPAFKEAPNVKTAEEPAIEPVAQPRGGKPSVGVSGKPTGTRVVAPRPAPTAPTAGTPAKPVGLGLVPSEQPAGQGDNAPVKQPSALNAPAVKPAVPATVAKTPQAPTPAVATETVEEAAQRKAEAEAMRKALEAVDKTYAKGPAVRPATPVAEPTMPVQKVAGKGEISADEDAAARATEKVSKLKSPFDILDEYKENKKRKSVNRLPGQSIDELRTEVAADKTSAGKALNRLMKSGKVKLVDKSPTPGLGGEFDGKTVTLYADGIPKGHAIAVALHEVGAHMGMKKMLGEAAYQKVADRIVEMAQSKEASPERALAQRALNRIPEADIARGKEVIDDEAIAYFVEELAKAEASGELPKTGPLRAFWNQIRAALVATINRTFGTTFGMGDLTPEQIGAFASSAMTRESKTGIDTQAELKKNFSVSYNAEQIIDSMGPLEAQQKSALKRLIEGFQAQGDVDTLTKARTQVADVAATVESRLSKDFNGAVRNSLGKLNPMGLFRQAQDYSKLLLEYFQTGTLVKDQTTGLYRSEAGKETNAPAQVYDALTKWGNKNGYSFERANNMASRVLEAVRLDAMREANKTQGTDFVIHKLDPKSSKTADEQIDLLVAEYKADKDLQALSELMDKPRIALVDHMIKVGRLTPEEGKQWKEVVGYVPFDRIEDFAEKFNKVKKISGKGIAQVGKLPELVGSINRPVGNVFDNYINTLGWMVGQVTKTDATINTLRSLEDIGQAKFLGNTTQGKDNTVGAYVGGELQYFQLPTKYDVMAFKDLNPPKAKWLQGLGAFSNILRTTVTAMPPFALKQVTDDVQRAIMTSGVKSPTALIRMSLTNFPKLALAELRGIQHPFVKEFGALGLTGEFDFQQGKPAVSLLADLGYKPRGKVKELLHRLEGITRASDLAVRKAIYDQTIKETNDALLAQTRAREFINFRRRGASDFVGAMVTTIPFFNAYIQGMDVLYRAASGADSSASVNRAEARKMFWNRAATVLALSTLYAMGKSDDDDYNEMDLRTRDGNWVLGNGVKLPVPTELGALFKVIPERAVEYMRRQGTPEEQEAFEAVRTAAAYIFEQYVGRTVPIPQAAKPLLEAWTNHSFLTGRELEGIHQKGMVPSMRRGSNTSELAIAIADFAKNSVGVEVSPIMVDNALRGYLGSTAATATLFTDSLLNPTRMDRPLHKWALVSNYAYDPIGTRRTSEFYETREQVGQLNNTLNELAKTDINAAQQFFEQHSQELALESTVNATLQQIEGARAYRKYLDSKEAAAEMTQEERKEALDEVRKYEVEMVRWLRDAKTQLRNQ